MKTLADVLSFAKTSAIISIDNAAEYGATVADSIASNRENIRDTLAEYSLVEHEAAAFEAFDAHVAELCAKAGIAHKNGTMTVTAANGATAKRKTGNLYPAAIVARVDRKLVVVYAGWTEAAVRAALARHLRGEYVNGKISARGVRGLEVVVARGEALAAIVATGEATAARVQAERAEAERQADEQAMIEADASKWEPVEDPDAWKAADAALIAARRK